MFFVSKTYTEKLVVGTTNKYTFSSVKSQNALIKIVCYQNNFSKNTKCIGLVKRIGGNQLF